MRITTRTRLAAIVAVAAAGVAACGGSSGGGGGTAGKSYTIACQGPLTGDNAALGINICDGAKLAIDQAQAKGDLPFTVKYKGVDDQGTPDGARPAAASIAQDSSIVAVVGPAFSGATQAAESTFAQAGILSMTASATNPTLTDPKNGFKTFYRAVATDSSQGKGAAQYLKQKLHVKKVYSIDDAEAYGQGLASTLEQALKSEGVAVVHDSVPQGTKQWEPEAAKVKQSGADAVYYSGYYSDAGPFAKALRNAGYKGLFMSDDGVKDPNFVKLAGSAASNGALLTCPCTDASTNKAFASAYKTAFKQDPGTYSAEAYDVANAIIDAMKSLGGNVTRQALVQKAATINYTGITKTIAFSSDHELKTNTVYLYKVDSGHIDFLGSIDSLLA